MDTERLFLGDVEYMHGFFADEERINPNGFSFARPYVDLENRYFIPSIVGHIRDIVPAGGQRQLLVLSKPTTSPLLGELFTSAYKVADDVVGFDRDDTSRLVLSQTTWCQNGLMLVSINSRTAMNGPLHIGMNVLCRVSLRREEHRIDFGSTTTSFYSRTFRMHAIDVDGF
ncbi:hypothetical protein B0H13DRAFT_2689282 [Mycena leptocephala]|nr:hypothetical protein B0H13DRAFT_2689282 [Mycena leptocephala]